MRAYIYDSKGNLRETIYSIKRVIEAHIEYNNFGRFTVFSYYTIHDKTKHKFWYGEGEKVVFHMF